MRGDRQYQRLRIGQPDVFRRQNRDTPRNEARVFAGYNHLGQPIQRRIRIAAAHGFYKRRNRVVVFILAGIVHDSFLLNGFLGDRLGDESARCRERANFERVQRLARVAVASGGQKIKRSVIGLALQHDEATLQQCFDVGRNQWLEFKNLRARDERGVDIEKRIVRRRTNQPHGTGFHVR